MTINLWNIAIRAPALPALRILGEASEGAVEAPADEILGEASEEAAEAPAE